MNKTYRGLLFACFLYAGLLCFATACFFLLGQVSDTSRLLPMLFAIAIGLAGIPLWRAKVVLNDEGIIQQVYRKHFIKWADITGWERISQPDSDGPDSLTIITRSSSLTLNHNCVYGRRLDEIEAELKKRTRPKDSA